MFETILIIIILILISLLIICFGIIRGFLRTEQKTGEIKDLSGKEIEFIRRKLVSIGIQSVSKNEVFSLIKTIRDTNLGTWMDNDPYFPADPYEDIDSKI